MFLKTADTAASPACVQRIVSHQPKRWPMSLKGFSQEAGAGSLCARCDLCPSSRHSFRHVSTSAVGQSKAQSKAVLYVSVPAATLPSKSELGLLESITYAGLAMAMSSGLPLQAHTCRLN